MRNSLWVILLVACFLSAVPAFAANGEEPYQQLDVQLPSPGALQQLLAVPNVELMRMGDGDCMILSRPSITKKLIADGWQLQVVHDDLEQYYASLQGPVTDYGIWHTYAETVAELSLLHSQYPNLTSAPWSLGRTIENRDLWAIKVSSNPGVNDPAKPEVLIDGTHHAREIMTVEMNLYFARYLCEHYGTDPVATYLLDHRQIYFVPIVNPDGFVYNEQTNPNGGGMWRKNRRNNGSGCWGVDNNRNYPYEWVGGGSSTNPCDDTYRGPSAGSEAENQAMIGLMTAHHFVTHDSYHSNSAMILFPWGYTLNHTPDDATFRRIARERARDNGYSIGQPGEILYMVNGGSFDYAYGEQTAKPKIYSFSTEIGGSGFWPNPNERDGLLAENLHSIIYLCQVAGAALSVPTLVVSGGNGDGRIDPGESVNLLATVSNDGLSAATGLTIHLRCDDPYVTLTDAWTTGGILGAGQTFTNTSDPFRITADATCPLGRQVTFTVVADAAGGLHVEVPFLFAIGQLPVIYADDFEQPGSEWLQDQSHTAVTGAFVRIDPVATQFQPGDDTTPAPGIYAWVTAQNPNGDNGIDDVDGGVAATRSPDLDLSGHANVRLSMNYFHGQRDGGEDPNGDFFRIDVSSNAGGSWVNLVHIGDVATAPVWRNLTVNLQDFITLTNQVRFRVQASDANPGEIIEGGIDDFYLYEGGSSNQPPSAPALAGPPNGSDVADNVTLSVTNAMDPEGDPLTYGFRVYSDSLLTALAASVNGVAQGTGTTSWQVNPPLPLGTYYWRAFAADPTQRGLYSSVGTFHVTHVGAAGELAGSGAMSVTAQPNPAAGGMHIRYYVPWTMTSRLAVYDPQGRRVRSLETVPSASGWHEIVWDGRDDAGRQVASGSYWVRLWVPGETRTVRVVRVN